MRNLARNNPSEVDIEREKPHTVVSPCVTEWLLAWSGAYIDMVDSLYLRYKEPISSM
jgi:hypothetical protein